MATLQQLESALVKAHAAGNADHARILAAEVRKMRGPSNDINQFIGKSTPMEGSADVDSGGESSPLDALLKLPALRGTVPYRVMQGMADPGIAVAQMGANAVGQGEGINQRIKDVSQDTAAARGYDPARGEAPFDPARLAGNIAITAPMTAIAAPTAAGAGLGANVLAGATTGARFGLLNPVENVDENFLVEKAKQGAAGAVGGAIAAPVSMALGRALSPKGNPVADALEARGVQPTIGQRLGGAWNKAEEKAMSIPIVGDAIGAARNRAREQFNTASINEAIAPIGAKVQGAGTKAVNQAHEVVSDAYTAALDKLKGVMLDGQAGDELSRLRELAGGMPEDVAQNFERILSKRVLDRASPAGGFEARTFKEIDSEIGTLAAKYARSPMASESQLGDALMELRQVLTRAAGRQNPEAQAGLKAADAAFARLVRIDNAAKAAKLSDGVFTPGQLMSGVMQADRSARKASTARGTALMQDIAQQGQDVLGNVVPDSGTAGRALLAALLGAGTVGVGGVPGAAALGGAAALYAPQSQRLLAAALRSRPVMEPFAQALRQYAPVAGAFVAPSVVAGQ